MWFGKKPNKTQPNSPVISIINRSISALIRSTISDSYNLIRVDCSIDSREFNAYNLWFSVRLTAKWRICAQIYLYGKVSSIYEPNFEN
jgi:hypothetical protein